MRIATASRSSQADDSVQSISLTKGGEDERRTVERRVRKKGTRVAFYGGGWCLFALSRLCRTFDSEVEFDLIGKNRKEANRDT